MARKDGRYKCSTKGCRNYISHGVLCSTCVNNAFEKTSIAAQQPTLETPQSNDESGLQPPAVQSVYGPLAAGPDVLVPVIIIENAELSAPLGDSVTFVDPEVVPGEVISAICERDAVVVESAPESKKRIRRQIDTADVVRRYQAGEKIVDIAVSIGFPRGQGQNKTRAILREAGVFHERQPDSPGYVAGT